MKFPARYVIIRPGVHHYRVDGDRNLLCGLPMMDKHQSYDYPPEGTRTCGSCGRHPQARYFK